jgi:ABC-type dipeptide/oligopeptide/nickel transport system permease component
VIAGVLVALTMAVAIWTERLAERNGLVGWIARGALQLGAFRVMAVPAFGVGLVWMMFLALRFKLFPLGGVATFGIVASPFLDRIWHLVLPGTVIALLPALMAAQAGVRAWQERTGEARWAALGLEAARAFADQAGWLVSSLLVVEPLFAFTGIGKALTDSVLKQDAPVLVAMVPLFATILLVGRVRAILLDREDHFFRGGESVLLRHVAAVLNLAASFPTKSTSRSMVWKRPKTGTQKPKGRAQTEE